jgi:hypothetical protein
MTTDPTPRTHTVERPQTNTDHHGSGPQTNTDQHRSVLIRVRQWLRETVLIRVGLWRLETVLIRVGQWLRETVLIGVCLWPAVVSVAERPRFESQRRDDAITVDGKFDDWYGHLQPFGADPVAIQFLSDGEFLYIRLTASDAATRMQIRRLGMTIWFDPAGGTKKKFGIKYPVVERGAGNGDGRGGRGGGVDGGSGRRGQGPPDKETEPGDRVDIIGPGKDDARSLTRDHLSGVEVAIRAEEGTLHYELKVPLAPTANHPYAIDTAPGRTIGVGLETGKMQQRSSGTGRGGGFGGGGGGGGGGGMGGRGRGGGMGGGGGRGGRGGEGQREFQPPKPLKSWAIVAIAPVR